jgi:hypothetical protein
MKLAVILGVMLVAACAPKASEPIPINQIPLEQEPTMEVKQVALQNLGPAPELQNEIWLNTDHALRLADLRGSVVLIDMWTFG